MAPPRRYTNAQIGEWRRRVDNGETMTSLAREVGTDPSYFHRMLRRGGWKARKQPKPTLVNGSTIVRDGQIVRRVDPRMERILDAHALACAVAAANSY